MDGSGGAVDDLDVTDSCCLESFLEFRGEFFSGDRDDLRMPAYALGESGLKILARSQCNGPVTVGEGLADGEG